MEENREINVEALANSLVDKNGNHIDLNELAGAYESVSALKKFLNHYTSYSKKEIDELAHFIDGLSGNDYGFREAANVRKKLEKNGFKKPYTPAEYKFKSYSEHFPRPQNSESNPQKKLMINCPECGKEISNRAKICPNCGVAMNREEPNAGSIIIGIICFVVGMFLLFQGAVSISYGG